MSGERPRRGPKQAGTDGGVQQPDKTRFLLRGWEMVEKVVSASGNSGRVYLPLDWSGKRVKVIRVD